jgi:hypothetical protein
LVLDGAQELSHAPVSCPPQVSPQVKLPADDTFQVELVVGVVFVTTIIVCFLFGIDSSVDLRKHVGKINPFDGCQFLHSGGSDKHVLVVKEAFADKGLQGCILIKLFPGVVGYRGGIYILVVQLFRHVQVRTCIVFTQLAAP